MIIKTGDADRFAGKPPASLKAALFFGPALMGPPPKVTVPEPVL